MMPRKQAVISQPLPQVVFAPHLNEKGGVTPFDITKTTKINATVGIQFVTFAFQDVGGTGNLLPGAAPNPVSETLTWPKGATMAVVFLAAFNIAYVDTSGDLVDHHLGQLIINLGFTSHDTVTCTFLLRDSSTSEGVEMFASGVVLYFDAD
jgi:hypothetical protein